MLIDYYKAIEDGSSKMLDAAKNHDWEGVVRYEGACAILIEQLCFHAKSEEMDAVARKEKSRIMLRILQNDAQIRVLAEPWLAVLEGSSSERPAFLH